MLCRACFSQVELEPSSGVGCGVGDVFETFIGPSLKGGQGQFFTPRNVMHLVRARMRPKIQDMVLGAFNPTWIQDGGTLEAVA